MGRPEAAHDNSTWRLLSLWLPVLVYMAALFVVSAIPDAGPPGEAPDWLLHGAAYFGLTLLLVRALAGGTARGVRPITLALAVAAAILYGASDEWHQSFVVNRQAEMRDLAADAIGALTAAVGAGAWSIIRRL